MFYLITIDRIYVKYCVNFIRCYVIICLHGCGHTKNFIVHTITFNICQIDPQRIFVGKFGAVALICCGIMLNLEFFWIKCCSQVLEPFAPLPSVPVIFFAQYSPYDGATVYHELSPLLTLLLPPLLFFCLSLECKSWADFLIEFKIQVYMPRYLSFWCYCWY